MILPHDRLYAAAWAAQECGRGLAHLGDTETALLLARAERVLAARGPAGVVEDLHRRRARRRRSRASSTCSSTRSAPRRSTTAPACCRPPRCARSPITAGRSARTPSATSSSRTSPPRAAPPARRCPRPRSRRGRGRPCRYFAYCNGFHSPSLVAALRRTGYEGAVTTCDRPNPTRSGDPFRITRKVLWEAHTRGAGGALLAALSAAHLHDTFGALGLTAPVDGARRPIRRRSTASNRRIDPAHGGGACVLNDCARTRRRPPASRSAP